LGDRKSIVMGNCDSMKNLEIENKKSYLGGYMTRVILLGITALIFFSCSSTYEVTYDTYLSNTPYKTLKFIDDKFDFSFIPVSNGIWFTIKNGTDQTAYLVWDKSYFIEPSGNSYKAIDYDAIKVVEEFEQKGNNETPIPAKSTFSRFTTANTNVKKFEDFETISISNLFSDYTYSTSIRNEFFKAGAYWPTVFERGGSGTMRKENTDFDDDETFLDKKCSELYDYILKNNNLGLGLFIKQNNEFYEYRFDFRIKEAKIYEVKKNNNVLKRVLNEKDNYYFQVIN
jgi:hypothetical protein